MQPDTDLNHNEHPSGKMNVHHNIRNVEDVVRRYTDMVVRIAFNNVRNIDDAEDIAQNVFIKFMHAKGFESGEHIKAWLIRVTVNMCKNHLSLFHNIKNEPLHDNIEYISAKQQELLDDLWKLPANYRNSLYLYYYEGYTIPEIAGLLGKSVSTVSTWLIRARKKLKLILIQGGYER